MSLYFTSDWHFGHDKEFIWGPRGYKSVEEMNETQVEKHNSIITDEDDVYVQGDLMLGNAEIGMKYLRQLKGKIHIVLGNHDTNSRIELYKSLPQVVEVTYATVVKFGKYKFYLSHYPTVTTNMGEESLSHAMINLFGHTHQTDNFYRDIPLMYHIGVDSHNGYPVSAQQIIDNIKEKIEECKNLL